MQIQEWVILICCHVKVVNPFTVIEQDLGRYLQRTMQRLKSVRPSSRNKQTWSQNGQRPNEHRQGSRHNSGQRSPERRKRLGMMSIGDNFLQVDELTVQQFLPRVKLPMKRPPSTIDHSYNDPVWTVVERRGSAIEKTHTTISAQAV